MTRSSRYLLLTTIAVIVIVLDQATKYWIMQSMRLHESIPVISNLFSLTYIRNPGAAFGLLASSSNAFRTVFFGVTSLLALGLLGTILVRMPDRDWIGQVSIAGILGGAIGNLIDRLRFGEVIDFLDAYIIGPNFQFYIDHYQIGSLEIGPYLVDLSGPHHWPAFNVADSAISVGVVCLMLHFALERKDASVAAPDRHPATGC
ncbi:MAG TPA: signal peptidase II [Nitrospira sp.]|nr:signal peptidase II [Nitrospira sp.]